MKFAVRRGGVLPQNPYISWPSEMDGASGDSGGSAARVCQSRQSQANFASERLRNVAPAANRGVTLTSGGSRGCDGTRPAFQFVNQPKRLLDDAASAAVFRADPATGRPDDISPSARMGAPRGVADGSVRNQGVRHAFSGPAWVAADRRNSPRVIFERARTPFYFRPRRVEAFVVEDRHRGDARAPRPVFYRL